MILDKNIIEKILQEDKQVQMQHLTPDVLAQMVNLVNQNEAVLYKASSLSEEIMYVIKNAYTHFTTDSILTDAGRNNRTQELDISTEIITTEAPSVSKPILTENALNQTDLTLLNGETVSEIVTESAVKITENATEITDNPVEITDNSVITTENATIVLDDKDASMPSIPFDNKNGAATSIAPEPPEIITIPSPSTASNSSKSTDDMSIFKGNNNAEDAFGKGGFQAKKPVPKPPLDLPNGKQKEPYEAVINWEKWGLTDVENPRFEGLEAIGLVYDVQKNAIVGTPIEAGDKEVILFYSIRNSRIFNRKSEEMSRLVRFYVFHDPRSLWTEHEPPTDAPYRKEHIDTLQISAGQKHLIAASRRGRSHAKDAKFRDDDFALDYNSQTGWFTIAVADGAGSAKFSREGSRLATQKALKRLTTADRTHIDAAAMYCSVNTENGRLFKEELYKIFGEAVKDAADALENVAKNDGHIFKDYYTTLLLAMCKKYEFGWLVTGFWVGDGGIGLYKQDWDKPRILGKPDSGEYSGQTNFLTPSVWNDPKALWDRIYFEIVDDFDLLALMTDGITDAKFHTDANLFNQSKWTEVVNDIDSEVNFKEKSPESDKRLLKWLEFWVKGEYDDRTIALMF